MVSTIQISMKDHVSSTNDENIGHFTFLEEYTRLIDPPLLISTIEPISSAMVGVIETTLSTNEKTKTGPDNTGADKTHTEEDIHEDITIRSYMVNMPKTYRVNIEKSGTLLMNFLDAVLSSVSYSSGTGKADTIEADSGANAAGKASTGTYSLKEIHTILNIFLKITEIEDNTIRLLVKDQDLEYDERQHDNETTTTNNMRILDKLLQCLEQLLSLFDSSNNTDSVDITIISNLMLLFGQLGCINISTKQFNRFSNLTHAISKLGM